MRRAIVSLCVALMFAAVVRAGVALPPTVTPRKPAPPKPAPTAPAAPSAPAKWGPELDAQAPPLAPKLLLAARVGGVDDQCLTAVEIRGDRVAAGAERNFFVVVTVKDDGPAEAKVTGNPNAAQPTVRHGIQDVKVLTLGAITYGYKQVNPILKQPYVQGPGWKLWDWTMQDCQASKAPYAPLMADSEMVLAAAMPNGDLWVDGKCDGGNTSLWCHPKDINTRLKYDIAHGGGKGTSSFLFDISPQGEYLRGMVLRGFVNCVTWDRWGRMLVGGAGITMPKADAFGYTDGAGLLLADREWKQTLLATHVGPEGGKASFWACAIDSTSGLAALAGYCEGDNFKEVHSIQKRPGGGKDGLLVIFRLWEKPEAAPKP